MAIVSPLSAPPALPGLPSHVGLAKIPEQYNAGRYGVTATVQVPARDVEIMNKMGQVVVILHTLAAEMNSFQGHMDSTRSVIRQCRALATELQDEIETRRGPQG
jgi:chemotaxis protein histidine kinase CheA